MWNGTNRTKKISEPILKLMYERRGMVLRIEEAIERNKGSKVFARDLSLGENLLTKLKIENDRIITLHLELLAEIENFYVQFYTKSRTFFTQAADPSAKLTRHYTEDILNVSQQEISVALKQLKNMIALQRLLSSVIHQ